MKRKINGDDKYQSEKIAKFINYLMQRGKKSLAQRILYKALDSIKEQTKKDPLEIFNEALRNATPIVEVRGRRVGGANFQIPTPVTPARSYALACRWIINAAESRKGKPMTEKLVEEILNASKGEGAAVKKKEDVHRMAEANKAFAHFARFTRH